MLSGIHPILTGDLLAALDRMGHGDTLVVADANFPAFRLGSLVVELPQLSSPEVAAAIRTVLPLDRYEGPSVTLMLAEGQDTLPVQHELASAAAVSPERIELIGRFAFYDRAEAAFLLIRTGELRPYGNAILRKGVINSYTARSPA